MAMAAFLQRLTDWFGVGGTVLAWFSAYPVTINATLSSSLRLEFGVPTSISPGTYPLYSDPNNNILITPNSRQKYTSCFSYATSQT